jgi:hypothetical protein
MSRNRTRALGTRLGSLASSVARPAAVVVLGSWPLGCSTHNNYYTTENTYSQQPDAGAPDRPDPGPDAAVPEPPAPDAGAPTPEPDAGPAPGSDGLPIVNTTPQALQVDVLGSVGTRFWFVVSEDQLARMNERYENGGGFPGVFGDIYTPGAGGAELTFADRLLVTAPGADKRTADFGKVQVSLKGESTGRPWTVSSLPNIKIDADEFIDGNRIGGIKHLRLNNAIIGSIFREKLTLDLYAKLGYPAPRASYAWVGSSVWGPEVEVPYVVVEAYKPQFCKQREAALGGGCVNMWEFVGDFGQGALALPESCQFSECDATRASELELAVSATPPGAGYKAALAEWLDWDAFHRFQCLSWILGTGDDALHNGNNVVLMERADGKFQHLPYSVDISLGQEWYPTVSLAGGSALAQGCQSDTECWADTIASCETLLDQFVTADPIAMLEQNYATLEAEGMLRGGDVQRHRSLESYLAQRLSELPVELEANREAPVLGYCEFPMIVCGDRCAYPEECLLCEPGSGAPVPPVGDAGVSEPVSTVEDVAADVIVVPPPGGGGEQPVTCVPPIEVYDPLQPIPFR